MSALTQLSKHLRPGRVYRRKDLAQWSTAVDRHLRQLLDDGRLEKVSGGLYMAPRETRFGKAPASDAELVAGFLGDDRFLLVSPNAYNGLGVGTTQLYNAPVVYNHKRHGEYALGGRKFDFRVKPGFPRKLSREFLLVDLVNNLDQLAESKTEILERVQKQVVSVDGPRLLRAVRNYGNVRTKKFFERALSAPETLHAD